MDLKEWAEIYFKHKDVLKKEIISMIDLPNGFEIIKSVKGMDIKEVVFICDESYKVSNLPKEKTWLVFPRTKNSKSYLIDEWDSFLEKNNLTLMFVNMKDNSKILISPNIHSRISEDKEKGIKALFTS